MMPFAAIWMDLEIIILNEVSQREKDKYHGITYTLARMGPLEGTGRSSQLSPGRPLPPESLDH